jgi:hypothetical protein
MRQQQILAAIANQLASINPQNGYNTNLNPKAIFYKRQTNKTVTDYNPIIFLALGDTQRSQLVMSEYECTSYVQLMAQGITRKDINNIELDRDNFEHDVKKCLLSNLTLNDLCITLNIDSITDWPISDDGNYQFIFNISCYYNVYGNENE